MITIRLQRRGRKHDPSFRVVVTDSKRAAQSGKYLEMVGSYDPRVDRVDLKADRITHWMQHGAQVSDTVHNLLISQKIIEGKKINVLPRKTMPKVEIKEGPVTESASVEPMDEVEAEDQSQKAEENVVEEAVLVQAESDEGGAEPNNTEAME